MTRAPLSVLIPTRNERANIRACVESARFAEEIVVVDSGSTDGTADEARAAGATVIDFRWDGAYPKKKNWALANVPWSHEWVFVLDADERVPPALAEELGRAVSTGGADGYYVNRRFWFMGGWLRHCGYHPSWNLRLFRHRLGRYEQPEGGADTRSGDNEVHEHLVLDGRAGTLRRELDHYAYRDIDAWVEKHNRYSNWEALLPAQPAERRGRSAPPGAALARKRRLKAFASRLPFRPSLRFAYHYVLRAGFLDGYRGYVFCRLMGFYEFLSVAKAAERRRGPPLS
jgi:glycosyltransferase involved in cell wall biosynthesis